MPGKLTSAWLAKMSDTNQPPAGATPPGRATPTPTDEGRRRYPYLPVGIYTGGFDALDADMYRACTCTTQCPDPCTGACGCAACTMAYNDHLSLE